MENLTQKLGELAQTKAIEKQSELSSEILSLLNQQIKNELYSSQLYYSIASYLDDKGFNNIAKVFFKYAGEEFVHMQKIYEYIYDRNSRAITPDSVKPPVEFGNLRKIYELGLTHEIGITTNWETIATKARAINDNTTFNFSQWFVNEQIKEEAKMRDVLDLLDQGVPEWYIESNAE
jgi:ferritin